MKTLDHSVEGASHAISELRRNCKRWIVRAIKFVAVLLLLSVAACSAFKLPAGTATYLSDWPPPGRQLVGVSLSGGGNRSALYSAYVLELLAGLPVSTPHGSHEPGPSEMSFADRIGYVSSVSGGSFASAYFGLGGSRPAGGFAPMIMDAPTPEYDKYFAAFESMMNSDWERQLLFGVHSSQFHTSNAGRLAGALDYAFLNKKTMKDLDLAESARTSPYLIFNATDYDSGRRFVMTTLPTKSFCLDIANIFARVAHGEYDVASFANSAQCAPGTAGDIVTPTGFDAIAMSDGTQAFVDSSTLRMSTIVTTSGAFPVAIGPLAYKVEGHDTLLHLIDGGLTDNSGVESLAQLFLGKLLNHRDIAETGLIVEVDASLPFDATGTRIGKTTTPVGGLITDVTRPSDIQEVRASYYRHDLWVLAQQRVHGNDAQGQVHGDRGDPDNPVFRLTIVKLQHTEFLRMPLPPQSLAQPSSGELIPLPHGIRIKGCGDVAWDAATANAKVSELPTRYSFSEKECAASMLRLAACWSVHLHGAEIQAALAGNTAQVQPVRTEALYHGIPSARIHRMCSELEEAGAF